MKWKKKKIIKKIGISIYDPRELDLIWKSWKPELVQVPFNVLDQRIHLSGWLKNLKDHNIEVHARSCFLQGLLINYKNINDKKFKKWQTLLNKWNVWCKKNKISNIDACINFVRKFKGFKYLIVGVDDARHLKYLLNVMNQKTFNVPDSFHCNDRKLIEPKNWRWKIKKK